MIHLKAIQSLTCDTLEEFEQAKAALAATDGEGMHVELTADVLTRTLVMTCTGTVDASAVVA